MIARRSKRVALKLEAETIVDDKRYKGSIVNFSREGILNAVSYERKQTFKPEMVLGVNFQAPSGQKINLTCNIKWLSIKEDDTHMLHYNLGMEILNTPQGYSEFVQSLYGKNTTSV